MAFILNASLAASDVEGAAAGASGSVAGSYFKVYLTGFLILIAVKLAAQFVTSVYRIVFEYANLADFKHVALALAAGTFASVTAAALLGIEPALAPRVILFSFIFDVVFVSVSRFLYVSRAAGTEQAADIARSALQKPHPASAKEARRVLFIGSGKATAELIAEIQNTPGKGWKPEIIVDDDKANEGGSLLGVEIASGRREIRLLARRHEIDEIIVAKPSASRRYLAAVLRECVKTRCGISLLPLVYTQAGTEAPHATLADLRKPVISDLLGRDRPRIDHRETAAEIRGRVVLVTGGAGVFGTELCKRILRYKPRRLIALDADEDGLAMLASEFGRLTGETEFRTVVASVRDAETMRRAFAAFRPHLIFHAAELKQIPLAQANPRETFLTNVFGLKMAADLAEEYSAEKFILVSTTRAAEPVSVAAACKRIAEMVIMERNAKSSVKYAACRFPNLIEGRGNVIAVFAKQIAEGRPVTVTDKDVSRSFIAAEEAALLTTEAAALAEGGEIYELGPGETIQIRELAEAMIRLSGALPYEDIDIVTTQLRSGERVLQATPGAERIDPPVADRIWLTEDKSGAKLPHWSVLWNKDPSRIDDAGVIELLRSIFPAYTSRTTGQVIRGVKIENE
ncbi:MAG: polysaccharide biosynthesis protein [Clostridiales Family XIII bacterium]|nr:polysaccharide biosynthesis protein [Clostridiales Family XIII bacterium]